jgi:hypothetical protein
LWLEFQCLLVRVLTKLRPRLPLQFSFSQYFPLSNLVTKVLTGPLNVSSKGNRRIFKITYKPPSALSAAVRH